ncbi:hypothetical protein ACFVGY_33695, partial [Streptomyces sp. NPDC127106]|uniref:hypothetical protein n=1 Tax=Streptomyces sp. NPDC127106 TaxID=3345360 RepID=UPI0036326E76
MEIPLALRWLLLALALVQVLNAVRALRAAVRAEPGQRTDPWLTFADQLLGVPVLAVLALGRLDLLLYALLPLGPVFGWQIVRTLRSRPPPAPAPPPGGGAGGGGGGGGPRRPPRRPPPPARRAP